MRLIACFLLFFGTIYAGDFQDNAFVRKQIEERWDAFQKNRDFVPFQFGRSDRDLQAEFENIRQVRACMWQKKAFEPAYQLIRFGHVRAPSYTAFAYNNTIEDYNASTLCLDGKFYIACQGPRRQDVEHFFHMLISCNVTHLVRLTDAFEGVMSKCFPYWEGLVETHDGHKYLMVPQEDAVYPVCVFDMAYWLDNHGVAPERLLETVLDVKRELKETDGLLAVHCSAGVGRTGTFLAAIMITSAIERGGSFSIEEIAYRLSLQRVKMIAKPEQYITLYRLAEIYSTICTPCNSCTSAKS